MPRKVRVATVSMMYRGGPTAEDNRARIRELLDQAGGERPDIICLPETFLSQGVPFTSLAQIAEPIPGPTIDMVAEYARGHTCYIICPLIGVHDGLYRNDAVLIDRQGQIAGIYAKIHPVVEGSEFRSLELGVTPGTEPYVFDTDFGRIGIQICFDLMYPEPWAELRRRGAELIFWCSAYDGGRHLNMVAYLHHVYLVSAVKSRFARVIDPLGDELVKTGWHNPVVAETIDLDIGLFHCDFNDAVIPEIHRQCGPDVTLKVLHEEGMFTLVSNRSDIPLCELVERFKLDPLDQYLARNARLQDAIRAGEPVPDLTPPYLGRTQWI